MKSPSVVPAVYFSFLIVLTIVACSARADSTPQPLPVGRNWSTAGLISNDNDWTGTPGFMAYRGDKLTGKIGVNPQSIVADGTDTPASLLANEKKPDTLKKGGVAEFEIEDPVIALKGSGTASAPFLLLNISTTGKRNITATYKLRDIEGSPADAIQPIAFQYRVGTNGTFTDVPEAFIPDASGGPNLSTNVTSVSVVLASEVNDQAEVQVRWITANAEGNDEWIGIDDIYIDGENIPPKPPPSAVLPVIQTNKSVQPLNSPRQSRP